jgi:serine/threonine protein kinase
MEESASEQVTAPVLHDRLESAWLGWCPGEESPNWASFLPEPGQPCSPQAVFALLQFDIEFRAKAGLPGLLHERYFEHPRLQQPDARLDSARQAELIHWDYRQRWERGRRALRAEYLAAFPGLAGALGDLQPTWDCPAGGRQAVPLTDDRAEKVRCPACQDLHVVADLFPTWVWAARPETEAAGQSKAIGPGTEDGSARCTGPKPSAPTGKTSAAGSPGMLQAGDMPVPGYRLVRQLGSGGFGEVWEAAGPGGFRVAFKFVFLATPAGTLELRALEIIREIRHPNLLTIFGTWQSAGRLIIGMELADRTLLDRLHEVVAQALPGIPQRELLRYCQEAARVLDYLNKPRHFLGGTRPVGIQHGDVKPQNILLVGEGVKVGDFGLLHLLEKTVGRHRGGMTPGYAAPEVLAGEVSRWSDQYALAVTYCHLRGGRLPFANRPRTSSPDLTMVSDEERPTLRRALATNPRLRWPSCRAFLRALTSNARVGTPGDSAPIPAPPGPAAGAMPTVGEARQGPATAACSSPQPAVAVPSAKDWEVIRPLVARLRRALEQVQEVDLCRLLPPPGDRVRAPALRELVAADLDVQWGRGRRATLEEYLKRYPELAADAELAQVLYAEYRTRKRHGDPPRLKHFQERFPALYPRFKRLLGDDAPSSHDTSLTDRGAGPARSTPRAGGDVLPGGGYRLVERLGSGSFGQVWRAEAPGGRDVAVKIIIRPLQGPDAQRELEALAAIQGLQHPSLLPIHQFYALEDRLLIVMGLAEGSLRDRLKECHKAGMPGIPPAELAGYLGHAAEALDYLHGRGVLHRDIKPDNILLLKGFALLADFGLARAWEGTGLQQGTLAGTMPYMAPEVFEEQISEHTDQYSLAATYVELRLGRMLFPGLNVVKLMQAHKGGRMPDLPELPPAERAVLLRALAKDPAARYPNCRAFHQALAGALGPASDEVAARAMPQPEAEPSDYGTLPPDTNSPPVSPAESSIRSAARSEFPPAWRAFPRSRPRRNWLLLVLVALLGLVSLAYLPYMVHGPESALRNALTDFVRSVWLPALAGALGLLLFFLAARRRARRRVGRTGSAAVPTARPDEVKFGEHEEDLDEQVVRAGREPAAAPAVRHDEGFPREDVPCCSASLRSRPEFRAYAVHGPGPSAEGPAAAPGGRMEGGVLVLEGHTDAVWAVAFSPDGRFALSGSMDNTVALWESDNGRRRRRFEGHTGGVASVVFAPGGQRFLSGALDGTGRLWDVHNEPAELTRLQGHAGVVLAVALSPDGGRALSGGEDGAVRLWDVARGQELRRFEGHASRVTGVAFSPDGRQALSAGDDGTVRLWDVETGRQVRRLDGHTGPVKSIAFAPRGTRALSGGEDGTVRLWDTQTGLEVRRLEGHTDWVRSVAFSPDGSRALSGSDDETIRVWTLGANSESRCLAGPLSSFLSVTFSPDGRSILSGGDDNIVRLWESPL